MEESNPDDDLLDLYGKLDFHIKQTPVSTHTSEHGSTASRGDPVELHGENSQIKKNLDFFDNDLS